MTDLSAAALGLGATALGSVLTLGALHPYTGIINSRYQQPDNINAGATAFMAQRADYVRDDVTTFRVMIPNFYATTTGEVIAASTRTVTMSIEYPKGTLTQIKFSGSATGSASSSTAWLISDLVTLAIPRGAKIVWRVYQFCAAGILFASNTASNDALGDMATTAGATDQTMNASYAGGGSASIYAPIMLATTSRPSILGVGDSRMRGTANTPGITTYGGEIMPFLAPYFGFANIGRGSMKAVDAITGSNFTYRAQLFQYVSHVVLELGINDLFNAATAAQVTTYRKAIRDLAPTKTWFQTTLAPSTTTTDAYATVTNQTPFSNNSERVTFNRSVRAGQDGFAGYFDTASATESSLDSGKFKAPPLTDAAITVDGVHVLNVGYELGRPFVLPSMIAGTGL